MPNHSDSDDGEPGVQTLESEQPEPEAPREDASVRDAEHEGIARFTSWRRGATSTAQRADISL